MLSRAEFVRYQKYNCKYKERIDKNIYLRVQLLGADRTPAISLITAWLGFAVLRPVGLVDHLATTTYQSKLGAWRSHYSPPQGMK